MGNKGENYVNAHCRIMMGQVIFFPGVGRFFPTNHSQIQKLKKSAHMSRLQGVPINMGI